MGKDLISDGHLEGFVCDLVDAALTWRKWSQTFMETIIRKSTKMAKFDSFCIYFSCREAVG